MAKKKAAQFEWLKIMYVFNIVIAGGVGLCILVIPDRMKSIFPYSGDSATYGILGSIFLAFGLFAVLGLWSPMKFVVILLFQLVYMSVWLLGAALPLFVTGKFPAGHTPTVVLFILAIIGDAIAIPFKQVFSKKSET
jgi:hypothetical protein